MADFGRHEQVGDICRVSLCPENDQFDRQDGTAAEVAATHGQRALWAGLVIHTGLRWTRFLVMIRRVLTASSDHQRETDQRYVRTDSGCRFYC